jgi:hypothetical protein
MTNLPPITNKQAEIVTLLYRHRYLSREHIQQLIHHKLKTRSVSWLTDLKEKGYVERIYNEHDFVGKTKPAVYYLGLNGIRYLRSIGDRPDGELRKRYAESKRKQSFIDHCLLLADCCLNVESASDSETTFSYLLPADYADPDNDYNFLEELKPNACFIKQRSGEGAAYLLEVFSTTLPRYSLKKKVKDYVSFLDEEIWQGETGNNNPPIVQLAFYKKADLIYAKSRAKFELSELYGDEVPEEVKLRFTTVDKIREQGLTAKIWEKLKVENTN